MNLRVFSFIYVYARRLISDSYWQQDVLENLDNNGTSEEQLSRRKTKQFSSYFRFPTSHTTVRAVPHTAVPILDTIRDTPPLK